MDGSVSGLERDQGKLSRSARSFSLPDARLLIFRSCGRDERDRNPVDDVNDPPGVSLGEFQAGDCREDLDLERSIAHAGDLVGLEKRIGRHTGLAETECLESRDDLLRIRRTLPIQMSMSPVVRGYP